jgi:phosphatidylinositol 3-kinase
LFIISGRLEGERQKPNYKDLVQNPVLNYSGVFQHNDLYVNAHIYANNQLLCMPVKTSYKYIEKSPWQWEEWLTLPLKISDLPRNALLAITVWDIESPQSGDVPVCGATISLFDKYGFNFILLFLKEKTISRSIFNQLKSFFSEFRQGAFELRMWPNKMADGSTRTTTPGIFSDIKESELDDAFSHTHGSNFDSKASAATVEEFPILDELDRLAKVTIKSLHNFICSKKKF